VLEEAREVKVGSMMNGIELIANYFYIQVPAQYIWAFDRICKCDIAVETAVSHSQIVS
jgi:hypothetical protein